MSDALVCSELARKKVGKSIFITGTARSGTTILGKLIHSFKNVEYAFEPPALFSLFSIYEDLAKNNLHAWKLLFESYLYEDFFINAISGRNINCNINDDSSIYKVKSSKEIESRLTSKNRKLDIEALSDNGVIAYKMPDMSNMVKPLSEMYPESKQIVIDREPIEIMHSLVAKGWFSDEGLKENFYSPHFNYEQLKLPFWLPQEDAAKWLNFNEIERCAYYVIKVMKFEYGESVIRLNYTDMLNNPKQFSLRLVETLRLEFGEKTEDIIKSIKPMDSTSNDTSILEYIKCNVLKDEVIGLSIN